MYPIIFEIGRFKLHSYGLMIFLAFTFAVWLATKRAKKVGIAPDKIIDLSVWIIISGLVGSRAAYVLFHLNEFRGRWLDIFSPVQSDGTIGIAGLVVLGGVVLTVPTVWWFLKRHNLPIAKTMDILILSLAFGIAIGRVGCFLNGCCFGIPTDSLFGVVYPDNCFAGYVFPGQGIHPTPLYEIFYSVVIGVILLIRSQHKRFEGELLYIFFILYGCARFINETMRFYKDSMIPFHIGGFAVTVSMLTSVIIAIGAAIMLIRGYKSVRSANDKR